ncbi:MAG TPA: glycosyltransferase [Gaiellales bacterium]|nr:glycosyltransferase [Gaiellales bacterium]
MTLPIASAPFSSLAELAEPYALLLAPGTEVSAEAIAELRATLEANPSAGLAGARIMRTDGLLRQAGGIVTSDGSIWSYGNGKAGDDPRYLHVREVDWVSTDCALLRLEALRAAGGFDPALEGEQRDADLAFALRRAGYAVVYQPYAVATVHDQAVEVADTEASCEISVVIPTHDRAELLRDSLESLARQSIESDRFEVIVVDDGSTDGTGEVCAGLSQRLPLRYLPIPSSGIAAAKNAGVRTARGAIVLFLDDDDVADPGLLAEHLRVHGERPAEHVAVLGYTTWGDWLDVTPLMRFVTDVGHYLFAYDGLEDGQSLDYTYFWGGRSSCKRSFLLRHGLFNPAFTFGSEDIELGYRLSRHGLEVVYAAGAVSLMNRAVTLEEFCRRVERQGHSQLWFSRLHADPSVQTWCGTERAAERWKQAEPELGSRLTRARDLAGAGGEELHALLWGIFDALKLKGISDAASEQDQLAPPPALCHEGVLLPARWADELRAQAAPEYELLRAAANRAPGSRIFVADLLLPASTRASGARRMSELLRLLAGAGHAVTFVAADPSDGPRFADELRRLGIETYAGDPERALLLGRSVEAPHVDLGELLAGSDFDLALLSLWYVAERYLEPVRRYAPRARVLVDTVDVHFLREQRHAELTGDPLLARGAAETRLRELGVYTCADALVAVTENDADVLRGELPSATVHVVGNIHDVAAGTPGPEERRGLLFVGNFLHRPNPDAVVWLHDEVMPLVWAEEPETTLTVAGFRAPAEVRELAGPRVDVVGQVPEMAPLLDAHRISVAPLRFGSGIKGKVCEALAAGLPVVTTSVGSEGMGLAPDHEVLLEADDPQGYADAIVRLLRDDTLWTRLAEGGRSYVEEQLSSQVAGERLARLVEAERARKTDPALTSIIVLALDCAELTRACLDSIATHTDERYEIVLVDNGSGPQAADLFAQWARERDDLRVVRNAVNVGFAAGNNQGLALTRGGAVVLLNNDTVVTDGWLGRMRAVLDREPAVGIVGPTTNRISGPQQVGDAVYDTPEELAAYAAGRAAAHAGQTSEALRVVGFCMLVRRAVVDRLGGLDERFGVGNFEDDDFSLRAAAHGFAARIALDAFVHHVGSQTFAGAGIDHHQAMLRNWTLFKEKWSIPPTTSIAQEYAVSRETMLSRSCVVPLPAIGRFHRPEGPLWVEADDSRVLAAAAGAIEAGRSEALAEAFAEAARWLDPHRRYQTRRRLAELVLDAPTRGETDWMALFAAGAGELLAVLEEEPREPILLNYLGVLLFELGEVRTAEQLFRAAFRLDPALGQAKQNSAAARRLRSSHTIGGPGGALAAGVRALAPRAQRVASGAQPAQGLTLSLCMIVKDEEQLLPACLEAARAAVDEMVIVDTGSTDATVEIAESFGAKVVHFPWNGSFADARNVSIEHATGDWILYLDADEQLAPDAAPELRSLLGKTWREAFNLVETNFTGGEGSGESVAHLALRVWRNRPEYRFAGRIHEQKTQSMPNYLPERFETTTVQISHYGYLKSRISAKEKSRRNIELLEAQVEEQGLNAFTALNLGTEWMVAGDTEKARELLEQAWTMLRRQPSWQGQPWAPMLLSRLATVRRELGGLAAARALVAEGLAVYPDHTDLVFKLALCAVDERDWAGAEVHVRRCLELGDAPAAYSGTVGGGTFLALALLGQLSEAQGRLDDAETQYREALSAHPSFAAPALALATLMFRRGAPPAEVEAALPPGRTSALLLAASACFEAGHARDAADWFARVLAEQPDNGAARVGLVEALLAERRYDEAVAEAGLRDADSPVDARLAAAELFIHALRADATALAGALGTFSGSAAEATLFGAWHTLLTGDGAPDLLPAELFGTTLTLLEALLRVSEFAAFETLHRLYERIDVAPALRSDVLAAIYFRRGFLDSAADEWIACFEAEPSSGALLGLAHVALAKDLPEEAATLLDEAQALDPGNGDAAALRQALAAKVAA